MPITFPFKEESSPIFNKIRRPVAEVYFKHQEQTIWRRVDMIIDSGADYTLLPHFLASALGINLTKDCKLIMTKGVGGKSIVYLLKKKIKVKLGQYKREIPLGFLSNDYIPPLLGRHEFLETFRVIFEKFQTTFE